MEMTAKVEMKCPNPNCNHESAEFPRSIKGNLRGYECESCGHFWRAENPGEDAKERLRNQLMERTAKR